ncbi:MAG TPA: cell division protein FtsZ [Caulobacteraceae bacterium]|nr:cell division protein FtsZ [Caulobacteraceae bacterium]
MAIHLSAPRSTELKPRIVVFGVGGAGGNAVNNMIESGLEGVEFVVANTDAQQLAFAKTELRIQLGVTVTQGLGAGAHPEIGMSAAEESTPEISDHLDGVHMIFITAGMGGGTGTGAAPIIAKTARERGILTVGVVTKPFTFEGRHRMRIAEAGISELQRYVDTLIVIPNQNLFRIANERTTFAEAFSMADQVLHSGVRSITDLMVLPGLINLDFADVRTVMTEMGKAMMGTGEASGEDRALVAAQNAIANPLLDEVSLKGARAVLVNVTGGDDMTLLEVDEAANAISEQVDPEANIIFGAAPDPSLSGKIRVSVVATGMDGQAIAAIEPKPQRAAQPIAAASTFREPAPAPIVERETPLVEPAVASIEPEPIKAPEPVFAPSYAIEEETPTAQPEPLVALAAQADLYEAPPTMVAPDPETAPVIVAEATPEPEVHEEPLFKARPLHEEPRPAKPGFLGLFGPRNRSEPPPPFRDYRNDPTPVVQARMSASGGAAAAAQPAAEEHEDAGEDLEIPSFLRRLAN